MILRCKLSRSFTKILLIYNTVLIDDEGHNAA